MKKGFTLIEILSVIIILGVIFLFITPKISNLIKESRNLSKEINEITIINSVKEYANAYEKDFYSSFLDVGDKGYILVSDIVSKGNITKEEINDYGVIESDYVEVELIDGDKFTYKFVSNMDEITVKFDLNGGQMDQTFIKVKYNEAYGQLPTPTKDGYIFIGWFTEKDGNNKVVSSTIVKEKKPHVLYAKWIKTVKLEVNLNGGTTTQNFEDSYIPKTELNLLTPTKDGYTFTGWNITSGNSVLSGNKLIIGSENTTITANWSATSQTLTVNLNGGSTSQSFKGTYKTSEVITLTNPTRTGYTFTGWSVTSGNSKLSGNTLIMGSQNTTITANWSATSQTLTVNLNGGSTSQSFKGTYKTNEVITLTNPIRSGYTFTGWSVTSGNSILSGNTLTMGSQNTTITANWKALSTIPVFTYTGNCEIVDDSDNVLSDTTTCGKSISSTQSTWTGNWKIKFLTSGTLTVSGWDTSRTIDLFLVGGGGGGGAGVNIIGGGGGGGGYTKTYRNIVLNNGSFYITVGNGGSGSSSKSRASDGGTSSAFGYSAAGGQGGASPETAGNGGSGGGIGGYVNARFSEVRTGGTGGSDGSNGNAAGQGSTTREFGDSTGTLYSGGGGGGAGKMWSWGDRPGEGGAGGGAKGGKAGINKGKSASANTGGGGGGGGANTDDGQVAGHGGKGGSGIVIIRNKR